MSKNVTIISSLTMATPDGPFTVVADDDDVIASGWTSDHDFVLHWHLLMRGSVVVCDASHVTPLLQQAADAVTAYYDGDDRPARQVPVWQQSTPFQARARDALVAVPYGKCISYADLASAAGSPKGARAAAAVCANNHTALFVPCHRVIRGDGSLGGFLYGLAIKQQLLDRETRQACGLAQPPTSRTGRPTPHNRG